jgi:WhiB family redox-sensing transcriptional regulator
MAVRNAAIPGYTPWNDGALQLATLINPQPWADQALCAQVAFDMHYPESGSPGAEAKAVCAMCPVRMECLQYAIDNGEKFGIWGGLNENERRHFKHTGTVRPRLEPKPRPVTERHAARLALYQTGATDPQIAEACGVSRGVIYQWRRHYGLPANEGAA